MKSDELVLEVTKTVDYVQANKEKVILWSVIAVLAIAIGGGGYWYYTHRVESANEALGLALHEFHAPIRPISLNEQSDELSFPTTKERDAVSLKDFQLVAANYSMLRPGKLAHYYLGVTLMSQGNLPEAEKELNTAISSGDSYVEALAKMALASVYSRENKPAEAERVYRELIDHPKEPISKEMAQLALATYLAPTKPAEAEKIYKDMESAKPPAEVLEQISKGRMEMAK